VLAIDTGSCRIVLTAKKSLIESKIPALHKFVDARVGLIADAVVHKPVQNGIIVEYFNNLKAFVPKYELTQVVLLIVEC
jgi:rRNA biogenesis protein RRP5